MFVFWKRGGVGGMRVGGGWMWVGNDLDVGRRWVEACEMWVGGG